MNRPIPQLLLLLLAIALSSGAGCAPPSSPPIPNVLVISLDTLRPDHLSLYGYPRETSPNLDRLASRGVVFEDAIAQAPWTSPSHASLFASHYPSALGSGSAERPGKLRDEVETLAEVFRAAGHRTAAFTGGGYLRAELGFDQGFESFDVKASRMGPSSLFEAAIRWLDGDPQRPFLLFLHSYSIHNYESSRRQRRRWLEPYSGGLVLDERLPRQLQSGKNKRAFLASLGDAEWRAISQLYDAGIATLDEELGRFIGELEARGLLADTLVVVLSDHGEELGDHGGSGHGYNLHEENIRVPLIFSHPKLEPLRVAAQVRLLDVAPTIVDLGGLTPPRAWRGESLRPLLEGGTLDLVAFSEHAHLPFKSMRTAEGKLIASHGHGQILGRKSLEFYERAGDPAIDRHFRDAPETDVYRRSMLAWVKENESETRFRGGRDFGLSDEAAGDLEALGYLDGESEESVETDDLQPWIDFLSQPRTK